MGSYSDSMADTAIDLKQALQIARTFNLAFNNAFMFGGDHQTTKDSSGHFFAMLEQAFKVVSIVTISVERGSVYLENHCVDKLMSVARIVSRFSKTGIQSVSFDRDVDLASVQTLFFMIGSLADFKDTETMQTHLRNSQSRGVRLNYVVYQKVTLDETVVNKDEFAENQLLNNLFPVERDMAQAGGSGTLSAGISELLSADVSQAETPPPVGFGMVQSSLAQQLVAIRQQLSVASESGGEQSLSPAVLLESVYKLKENLLEQAKIRQATGVLAAADERAVDEVTQLSYQVIVRLIKEEYRNDRSISVKRLAQIIRRMLPDIKELKYLLPQLKDGLFAEGMSPAEYLLLVKELSKELASDELMQVMVEASDMIGLTFNELVEGIKDAPEEAARLIVLASEIKKGGVTADDQQMSAVLSDYIEKVSKTLALEAPEVSRYGGGTMLKAAVSRIEQELMERLKNQDVSQDMLTRVAQNLAHQFTETVADLKSDWIKTRITIVEQPDEDSMLSIFEQVIENGRFGYNVTEEIRSHLIKKGYAAEALDELLRKAQVRAASAVPHALEIPEGVYDGSTTTIFLDREIRLNLRYNTPFSTMLISYEKVQDPWTTAVLEITPDVSNQLINQSLELLKELMKRDTDIIGMYSAPEAFLPLMILPMTEVSGAFYIQKRLYKQFVNHSFNVNGISVQVTPRITALGYSKKLAADMPSFLQAIYQHHQQQKG